MDTEVRVCLLMNVKSPDPELQDRGWLNCGFL
jgi:hypothetical protein